MRKSGLKKLEEDALEIIPPCVDGLSAMADNVNLLIANHMKEEGCTFQNHAGTSKRKVAT
mgnify:CR=1 FL=1